MGSRRREGITVSWQQQQQQRAMGPGQLRSGRGTNGDGAAEDWTWRKDLSPASLCCQLSDNMHE